LTIYKSKENLPFKNALLTITASNVVGPFQRFISETISGIRYLLGKEKDACGCHLG
jgi:hypothetical protein